MKKLVPALLTLFLIVSCQQSEICDSNGNETVNNVSGRFYFDDRFDRYVLHHHVPGTIDAFRVFIFCDAPINNPELLSGTILLFMGKVGKLDDNLRPSQMIAGEEFFVVAKVESLNPVGASN
jgi:hypothetical protein